MASGWKHMAALTSNGDLYVWGSGDCGQLGTKDDYLAEPMLVQEMVLYNQRICTIA